MTQLWHPASTNSTIELSADLLTQLAEQSAALLEGASVQLTPESQTTIEAWLIRPESDWLTLLQSLPVSDLMPLAIFFTAAEEQINHWHCGSQNPAIYAFKLLKNSGETPDKSVVKQLKKLTTNRYIPYGAAL